MGLGRRWASWEGGVLQISITLSCRLTDPPCIIPQRPLRRFSAKCNNRNKKKINKRMFKKHMKCIPFSNKLRFLRFLCHSLAKIQSQVPRNQQWFLILMYIDTNTYLKNLPTLNWTTETESYWASSNLQCNIKWIILNNLFWKWLAQKYAKNCILSPERLYFHSL